MGLYLRAWQIALGVDAGRMVLCWVYLGLVVPRQVVLSGKRCEAAQLASWPRLAMLRLPERVWRGRASLSSTSSALWCSLNV